VELFLVIPAPQNIITVQLAKNALNVEHLCLDVVLAQKLVLFNVIDAPQDIT